MLLFFWMQIILIIIDIFAFVFLMQFQFSVFSGITTKLSMLYHLDVCSYSDLFIWRVMEAGVWVHSAKAVFVPHQPEPPFISSEMGSFTKRREFSGFEWDEKSHILKSLEAISGKYKNMNFNGDFHVQITWKDKVGWEGIYWT